MSKSMRIVAIFALSIAIILSCTFVGPKLTNPATYSHTIEALDKNRTTILELSAASTAAAAAISAIPDDTCTPIANQLSQFSTWFLLILSVIFLEKYLLTVFGAATCYLLFPIGFSALLINLFFPKPCFKKIGTKLLALGAALILIIPTSVWVSDQINATYSESIDATVQAANSASEISDDSKTLLDVVSNLGSNLINRFKSILNRFIEATAVMAVTNCFIPILVALSYSAVIKALFNVQIYIPPQLTNPIANFGTGVIKQADSEVTPTTKSTD